MFPAGFGPDAGLADADAKRVGTEAGRPARREAAGAHAGCREAGRSVRRLGVVGALAFDCAGLRGALAHTLRDEANYIRQEVTVQTLREPIELVEVVLLEMRVPQAVVAGRVDGSPVVSESLFFGVEHPAAASTVLGADTVRCSYPYHNAVTAAEPLTLGSVIGVFPPGQRRRGFLHYLERERAHPYRPFLHHNNGEQIGLAYWEMVRLKKTAEATAFRAAGAGLAGADRPHRAGVGRAARRTSGRLCSRLPVGRREPRLAIP